MTAGDDDEIRAPREAPLRLFLRFLRFGLLAWGGPVAQIGMLRDELVARERWVSPRRFNRVLGVYQALPGPEATELSVYFGYLARGRLGAVLAGLGFMLPGFVLMLALAWAYARFGLRGAALAGIFYGMQAAVIALVARAIHRIGAHALTSLALWAIAAGAAAAQALGVSFWVTLPAAGAVHVLLTRRRFLAAAILLTAAIAAGAWTIPDATSAVAPQAGEAAPSALALLWSGLKAGLLTFGGAYTVIPYLRDDAVGAGGWMSDAQFLDGLALGGVLPAPLVIFGTFVGYVGGGFVGAVALTVGIFLPAFSFTLLGHRHLERVVDHPRAHAFLDGLTAGVVGLIAITAIRLAGEAIPDLPAALVALGALGVLYGWRAKASIAVVVVGAGLAGLAIRGV